mgnify:CR=1 FL=1
MRLLLDTHAWLWMQVSPEKFSPRVVEMLQDPGNALLFSSVSSFEIVTKFALGKLPLPAPPSHYVPERVMADGLLPLPLRQDHALQVSQLPLHHKDPFDRLLIAQAQVEKVPLLTADRQMEPYEVEVLWANRG